MPRARFARVRFCDRAAKRKGATSATYGSQGSELQACPSCGASGFFAEAVVYTRGPGRVARCRACGEMLAVLVTIRGITCVDLRGIAEP
jgi:hypothetical protein